jgi:uncharacterized protein Gcw-chp
MDLGRSWIRSVWIVLALGILTAWPAGGRAQQPEPQATPPAAGEESKEAEEPEGTEVELTADLFSRYFWRGFDLNDNKPGLQPSVNIAFPFGLAFNVWGSIGLDKSTALDEVDLTATYTHSLIPEKLDLTLTFVSYLYLGTQSSVFLTGTNEFEDSFEAGVGLSLTDVWGSPTLTYYRGLGGSGGLIEDGQEVQGTGGDNVGNYLELTLEKEFSIQKDKLSLAPKLAVGYQDEYGLDPGISHLALTLPLTYSLKSVSIIPSFSIAYIPRPDVINGDDRHVLAWGGLSLKYDL